MILEVIEVHDIFRYTRLASCGGRNKYSCTGQPFQKRVSHNKAEAGTSKINETTVFDLSQTEKCCNKVLFCCVMGHGQSSPCQRKRVFDVWGFLHTRRKR